MQATSVSLLGRLRLPRRLRERLYVRFAPIDSSIRTVGHLQRR
jgi:hypothetical protein